MPRAWARAVRAAAGTGLLQLPRWHADGRLAGSKVRPSWYDREGTTGRAGEGGGNLVSAITRSARHRGKFCMPCG